MKKNLFLVLMCGLLIMGFATGCNNNSSLNNSSNDSNSDISENNNWTDMIFNVNSTNIKLPILLDEFINKSNGVAKQYTIDYANKAENWTASGKLGNSAKYYTLNSSIEICFNDSSLECINAEIMTYEENIEDVLSNSKKWIVYEVQSFHSSTTFVKNLKVGDSMQQVKKLLGDGKTPADTIIEYVYDSNDLYLNLKFATFENNKVGSVTLSMERTMGNYIDLRNYL